MKFGVKASGLKNAIKGLKAEQAKLKDMTPLMRNVGEYMTKSIVKRFDTAEGPDGTAWKPISSPSPTRERRSARGNGKRRDQMKPLNDTGALRRSIHYEPSPRSVKIGTNLDYAMIHQYGGDIKVTPKMRKYLHSQGIHLRNTTNTIHIPARPFLGLSDRDADVIRRMMRAHISGR